jgi:hypothetical protein
VRARTLAATLTHARVSHAQHPAPPQRLRGCVVSRLGLDAVADLKSQHKKSEWLPSSLPPEPTTPVRALARAVLLRLFAPMRVDVGAQTPARHFPTLESPLCTPARNAAAAAEALREGGSRMHCFDCPAATPAAQAQGGASAFTGQVGPAGLFPSRWLRTLSTHCSGACRRSYVDRSYFGDACHSKARMRVRRATRSGTTGTMRPRTSRFCCKISQYSSGE